METRRAFTLLVTLLAALCTQSLVASADEPAPQVVPAPPAQAPAPAPPSIPESSEPLRVFGGIFLGLSSVAAVTATIVGATAAASSLGCGLSDGGCGDAQNASTGSQGQIAMGFAIGAAVTAAIGIPMLVAGTNQAHAAQKTVQLGFAPVASHGGGATTSLTLRF